MFQFSGFSSLAGLHIFNVQGCPIRTSMDQRLFATPHSFSQLTTSFVVSESQGIHHTPLFASYSCLPLIVLLFFTLVLSTSTASLGFRTKVLKTLCASCQFCTDTLSLLSKNFLLLTSVYLLPLESTLLFWFVFNSVYQNVYQILF
jgi:hypothetical protein